RQNGKRLYGEEALDRIAFIQFARACGFRLDEIAALVSTSNGKGRVSERWQQLASKKVTELDELIAKAEGMKRFLSAALTCKCVGADACGPIVRDLARAERS